MIVNKSFAATFDFSPSFANLTEGCNYQATIMIDTQGQNSNASDIIINYNISGIDIIDSNSSLPGKQIGQGNAYELYVGNEVDETLGRIRLTGSSFVQNLNGNKVFTTINFKSKPSISSTTFNILYSGSGVTLDSNIAEASTSLDILSGVTNATFNFAPGDCFSDTTPPTIDYIYPLNGSTSVPLDSNVEINISDSQAGVDISTVVVTVNGKNYTVSDPEFSYSGNPSNYNITIDPSGDFPSNTGSTVRVEVRDLKGNKSENFITFNIPYPSVPVVTPFPTGTPIVCPTTTPTSVKVDNNGETIIVEKIVEKECSYTSESIKEKIIKTSSTSENSIEKIIEKNVIEFSSEFLFSPLTPILIGFLSVAGYAGIILLNLNSFMSILPVLFMPNSKRHGVVANSLSKKPISFAEIKITHSNGNIHLTKTDIDGHFWFEQNTDPATIQASKVGFEQSSIGIQNTQNTTPIISMSAKNFDIMAFIQNICEIICKVLIQFSPYLLGVGLTLSIIQGVLDKGNPINPFTISYIGLITAKIIKNLA